MNNFLQFHDAYIESNKLYFSAKNMNGLFCYDLINKKTHMIATFSGEALWGKNIHHQIISYNRNLYFIPFMGRGISKFNLDTREQEYIELFENEINTIAGAFLLEDRLLLVPMKRPQLLYLDLKTNSLENIHIAGLKEILQGHGEGGILFDLQGACLIENQLILALYKKNYYLSIDLDCREIQKHALGEEEKLDNVYFDGDNLWINSATNTSVFRIAYGTEQVKKYKVYTENQCDRPFFSVEKMRDKIVLMPYEETAIYYFSEEKDDWIKMDCSNLNKIRRVDSQSMLFWKKAKWNNRLFLFPEAENGIWALDKNLQFKEKIVVDFSDKARMMEHIDKEYFNWCINRNISLQEENIFLDGYIRNVSHVINAVLGEDAIIGKKIYSKLQE